MYANQRALVSHSLGKSDRPFCSNIIMFCSVSRIQMSDARDNSIICNNDNIFTLQDHKCLLGILLESVGITNIKGKFYYHSTFLQIRKEIGREVREVWDKMSGMMKKDRRKK